jgi:serine/threonine protein kinase
MAEIPSSSDVLLTTPQLKTLDDFYILNEIGEGSYSTVYLASTKDKHKRCALKVCSKQKIQREKKVFCIFLLLLSHFLDQASLSRER